MKTTVRLCLLITIGIFVSFSAWAKDDARFRIIKKGIEQNDIESVKKSLGQGENPFRCQKKGLGKLLDNTPSQYCPAEGVGQSLLKETFKAKPCRDEIAVELLKAGARYDRGERYSTEALIKDAYEAVCPKVIGYIIKTSDQADVAAGASKYFGYAERKVKSYIETLKEGYEVDKEGVEALKPISDSFRDFVMSTCPDISKSAPTCFARESFESSKANIEKVMKDAEKFAKEEDAKEEFLNSPEGMKAAACEIDQQITEAQAEIDRQKRIGKVSGTVNMVVLNSSGAKIVDLQDAREHLAKNYRLKTKRSLPRGTCK